MKMQASSRPGVAPSKLALGCELLGGNDWGEVDRDAAVGAVISACQLGISVFDTADVYGLGRSEELLADSLGDARTAVTICTKFGINWHRGTPGTRAATFRDCRPQRVQEALEGSLRRLKLDCMPIYLMHWPDPAVPIADTIAALRRCQEQGKVARVGVSNCSATQIREAHEVLPLSVVQLPLSLVSADASAEVIECCRKLDIEVMTYGPLAQGLLSGKFAENCRFESNDRRHRLPHFSSHYLAGCQAGLMYLQRIAERYGKTQCQVALRWVLDYPGVATVVVGARTAKQVEENLGAIGWNLDPDEWNSLAGLWKAPAKD